MRYKKIMMLAIFLVSLLAISAVSAADNTTSDVVGVEETTVDVVKETTDEVVSVENDNDVISANESDWGTFDELAKEINAVEEGGILNLTKDYKYVNGSTDGIQINKAITIDGQGHTIDGNKLSRLLFINSNDVILNNITFINGNPLGQLDEYSLDWQSPAFKGGALYVVNSTRININKCKFIHNHIGSTSGFGGAIYIDATDTMSIYECYFDYCMTYNANFIYCKNSNNLELSNSTFVNLTENAFGSALAITANHSSIHDIDFIGGITQFGGTVFMSGSYNSIYNCKFINNTVAYGGGNGAALQISGKNFTISNCSFSNSTTLMNGAVSLTGVGTVENCNFIDNNCGDMIISDNSYITIIGCMFYPDIGEHIMGNESNFDIIKTLSSNIFLTNVNTTWDQETTFLANVKSGNKTINGGTLSFYIDDKFIGNASVVNGTSILIHEAPGDAGNHIISAMYNGINYLSSNGTAKMFVDTGDMEVEDYDSIATFMSLAELIKNTPEGGVLNLTKDYIYISGSTEGIRINKAITIDGKGHYLDGNYAARIFYVTANNIILKNITIKNAKSNVNAGAIYWMGSNGNVYNCIFINNSASYGGAILWQGANGNVSNCTFINHSGNLDGAAISWSGTNGNVRYCNFINDCGAIGWNGDNGNIMDCYFTNNYNWQVFGSAIYWSSGIGNVSNCVFENNSAFNGAIYLNGGHINVLNCDFINNYAKTDSRITRSGSGSAICANNGLIDIYNCNFSNNYAESCGAAIFSERDLVIANCTFINNSAKNGGGAIYLIRVSCNLLNSNFTNNSANYGSALYIMNYDVIISSCRFVDNNSTSEAICQFNSCENVLINNSIFLNNNGKNIMSHSSQGIINNTYFLPENQSTIELNDGVIIIKRNAYLTGYNISFFYKNSTGLSVLLKNDTVPLKNKIIIINLNKGELSKTFITSTDENGIATLSDELNQLDTGVWNTNILYEGNDNYYSVNTTINITVNSYSTVLTSYDVNATVGHKITVIANVISNLTVNEGIVTFFDGETNIGEANVVDGVATLTYTPSTAGEHTIAASFNSTNYLSSNSTAKLLVDNATVEVLVNTGTVGYNSTFVANVKGLYSTINEGSVSFYINEDYLGQVPVVDGSANLVYTPLTVGDYTVRAVFSNSAKFLDDESSTVYTVKPVDSTVTIDDLNGTVGHELMITVTVVSSNNLTINEGVVIFFDGENSIGESNVVDGVVTLTYTPSTAGEHTIVAIFNSDNYGSSNDTALLTVSKADVDLSIDYIADVYFTNPSNFAVNVNSNYKPVNEGKIKYYVNNELVGTVDVYEGNANFNYVTGTAGSFTLTAAYEETDNYFAKNASATFNVNKMPTTLSGESIVFDEEAYKTFTTELKDNNNNGVGSQPVKIEVIKYSGESATFNGISDANGITIYDVGRLAGGMWYVTGIYAGNNNYINSRFVDKFIVVRMNTTTEIEEIDNPKVNHNYKLKANIHDENGKLVKEGIVQFYLDGVDIGSIDLSKNQGHQDALSEGVLGAVNPMFEFVMGADDVSDLYINYVPTNAGKHTLTAVYEGTTIYKASNSTTSFDVSNSNTVETSIVASDVSTVYNGGKYIVIKLKDVNGKAVSGVKVTVVLGGKTYTPTTKNGQAKVSTNGLAPVKTYKATITFKGNSKYDKSTTTAKVVVKKATPKLTAKAKTFKKSVKTKKYSITLKTNQNKVMKNTKLTLKVNGKTYSAKTNAKGQATFKITKLTKKGKFTATIKYAGSKYYNAKTVTAKITVK